MISLLVEYLNTIIRSIGNEQAAARIDGERMQCPEFPGTVPGPTPSQEKSAVS
jgi:hypothetical protein